MIYKTVLSGTFLSRPNRFIAHVKIGGETHVCHVKNTGRCRELLVPGAEVYLEKSENPARKTLYDLIAVKEQTFGISRFDFYGETGQNEKWFLEVKGVTLEENGVVRFPDAPTQRGAKHLRELCRCAELGYHACVLFVIQMKGVKYFEPNTATDPDFSEALRFAASHGVRLLAYDCLVTPNSMVLDKPVEIRL